MKECGKWEYLEKENNNYSYTHWTKKCQKREATDNLLEFYQPLEEENTKEKGKKKNGGNKWTAGPSNTAFQAAKITAKLQVSLFNKSRHNLKKKRLPTTQNEKMLSVTTVIHVSTQCAWRTVGLERMEKEEDL